MDRVIPPLAALSLLLSGCGSGSSPPLTLSCRLHRLPSGLILANVTVRNTTSQPRPAIVYGPVLIWVRHIAPVLRPAQVVVTVHGTSQSFIGFALPRVDPKRPVHVLFRFSPPPQPRSLVVAGKRSVRASSWHVLNNPDCRIRRLR